NFQTTGEFGSNQVSTAFGLGLLLSFYLWLAGYSISGNRWLDIIITMLFTFQGLLSFSRGGMIGGALGIIIVLLFMARVSKKSVAYFHFKKVKRYFFPVLFFLGVSIFFANKVTGGILFLRYQGETAGTLSGKREKDLNLITTGRLDLFLSDLELVEEYGIFGVGAAASKYLREYHTGVSAHVESSRLLAEHGVLGFLFLIGVLILFFKVYKNPNDNLYKSILFAFLVVGWYTTFHAATRTYITPLLMGLSTIYIVYGQGPLSRN
uniref:O-antigen ligase family protein n=1 Tax=Cecembia rubra TaxID=1485585 RepID=UPI002714BFA8